MSLGARVAAALVLSRLDSSGVCRYRVAAHWRSPSPALLVFSALLLYARYPVSLAAEVFRYPVQYTHTAWIDSPGLKGRVNSIAQTTDGYLWLGTEFGLIRFDGSRFVSSGHGVGPPLPSANILSLLAGRDGSLWVGTLDGLVRWHQGELIKFRELAGMPVFSLLEDREGTVWAGGTGGLCTIRAEKSSCTEIQGLSSQGLYYSNAKGSTVHSLFEDREGHLWVGTESGLWRWTPGPPRREPTQIFASQAMATGDRGTGLIAVTGAYHRVLMQTTHEGLTQYTIPGIPQLFGAESLLRDRRGALWIGTIEHGILHIQDGQVSRPVDKSRLSGRIISALVEDREGTIWAGTSDGLDQFRNTAVFAITANEGLSTPVGCVLAARDGSVWIGAYGGLNRWNRGQLTIYRATPPTARRSVLTEAHESEPSPSKITQLTDRDLPSSTINSLSEDSHGRIWVGTDHGTAWFENGRFHRVRGLPDTVWIAMYADTREGVWISYPDSGLFHVIGQSAVEFVRWPWSTSAAAPRLSAAVSDPRTGGLWLGSLDKGIANFKSGQSPKWLGRKEGLGSDTVWNLEVDHEGALWAATEGGLSRVKNGRVMTLTSNNGLPCDSVKWVIEDATYALWLNTTCGLLRIERADLDAWISDSHRSIHALVLNRSDGVRIHALGAAVNPVVSKSTDGKLWFVLLDGVAAIDPQRLQINPIPPPVHIEQITANGQVYPATPGLRLAPRLRDLTIDYTALSLVDPERIRFRFKLEGQDREWREVLNVRRVQYSNLPPGSYRFRVTATNNSGVWNEKGASLAFSVAPAYWQTNWFLAACITAIVLLFLALSQLRLRQVRHAFNVRLEERVRERTRIARDLHDTLLQSLQGLLLRFQKAYDLYQTRPADGRKMLESAIDRTSKAIAEGRDAVQGLRASTAERNDLARAITTLGEELATETSGHAAAQLQVGTEGMPRTLQPIVRDEIYRIASEALRNAFRHAQARQIEVELRYDRTHLRLRVRDDGKGVDPKLLTAGEPAGHYGIHGMRERAKLMGGNLTVWTAPGAGTEIELSIPAAQVYAASSGGRRPWLAVRFFGGGREHDRPSAESDSND